MASLTILTGGAFQDCSGNPLENGYLTLQLSQSGTVPGVGNITNGQKVTIALDEDGNCVTSPPQYAWANANITPAGTFYRVAAYTAQGQCVYGPNNQVVGSGESFNVGTWIPNQTAAGTSPSGSLVSLVGTGGFQSPGAIAVAGGSIEVTLQEDIALSNCQICAGRSVWLALDDDGNIESGSSLWAPATYQFKCYTAEGSLVWTGDVSVTNPTYQLITAVSPSGSGTVVTDPTNSPGDPAGFYAPATSVQLTSDPDPGFIFSSWTGSVSSTSENPTTIDMTASESVVANNLAVSSFLIHPGTAIRYVTPGGIINTLNVPAFLGISGIALDQKGNLFVADYDRATIYKVTPGLEVIPFVGAGSSLIPATFSTLAQICTDSSGNLYIADSGAHTIYAVNLQSTSQTLLGISIAPNAIAIVAGGNGGGNTGDGSAAVNSKIVCYAGICTSAAGLYISTSDSYYSVRFVNQSGVISTVAGTGNFEYSGPFPPEGDGGLALDAMCYTPSSIACDAAGNLYVNDQVYSVVRCINRQATTQTIFGVSIPPEYINVVAGNGVEESTGNGGPALDAGLYIPIWLSFGPDGSLFIFQNGAPQIRVVSPSTQIIEAYCGTGVNGYGPDNVAATSSKIQNILCPLAIIGGSPF